ncbi:DNA-binding transcriptional regulator, CsgD family [Colwellia chukchiensis]|uniref:DNA-binding transcriptional regulator, CsgD family n=1 Tax=Colwellia chukchiensis TaxID=641665 RepID=A0A1H7G997_9GAMM|nr:helix-turn-helix transcriptional regulator [Colwellia chukchiensis]SEK34047.1 DNA-binding transcriptional regulator, CsgD family [Colwellia chukchiensis]
MQLDQYSNALITLTQSVGTAAYYQNLKNFLATIITFDELLILQFNRAANTRLLYRYATDGNEDSLSGEESWKYLTRLYVLDPFYRLFADKNRSGFFQLSEIAPDEFATSYSHYFNFLNVVDELGYLFPTDNDRCFHIDISRFGDAQPFSAADKALLSQLYQPLQNLSSMHLTKLDDTGINNDSNVENVLVNFGREILTKKEYQVCQLLLQGHSTKAIAAIMAIGYETVKMHKKNIYGKTFLSSQSELLALFIDILQQEPLANDVDHLLIYVSDQ